MPRLRDLLVWGGLPPGRLNAITDVPGVRVGHATVREGRLCTGVTAVLPRPGGLYRNPVTAGCAVLNGYGKSVGLMQVEELGTVETPVLLTSTLNVPRVADALITWMLDQDPAIGDTDTVNPVVLECFDGYLNDAPARAVGEREVRAALDQAADGPVAEGCVGAGTGLRCQGFKSGVGTASRLTGEPGYTVGVLALPNFGFPQDLVVAGVPVGRELAAHGPLGGEGPHERGSCVFVLATDAPLGPGDLRRLARRCFLGMARTGAISGDSSGDLSLAFSTAAAVERQPRAVMNALFRAAVEAAEEAILNALFMAETTRGRDGRVVAAVPLPAVLDCLRRHGVEVRDR